MNREILFRGKRTDNGEWIYGNYCYAELIAKSGYEDLIIEQPADGETRRVIPETVGQYTGLTDKNGQKIFEGDIVKAVYQSNCVGVANIDFGIGVVEYADSYYGGARYHINIIGDAGTREFISSLDGGVKVIGNIHDNPEFLEVQNDTRI